VVSPVIRASMPSRAPRLRARAKIGVARVRSVLSVRSDSGAVSGVMRRMLAGAGLDCPGRIRRDHLDSVQPRRGERVRIHSGDAARRRES
jgi:hypothetical protein